jgi:hypothetical protein
MKKTGAIICIVMITVSYSFSQDVEVIRSGATLPKVKQTQEFHFLHRGVDTTLVTIVGTFKATGTGNKSRSKPCIIRSRQKQNNPAQTLLN